MTKEQRAYILMHTSRKLDYWTPRMEMGYGMEADDQHEYYTKFMKFLVTKMDTERAPVRNDGANLVFPCI